MTITVSTQTKIHQLVGLLGTKDVSLGHWERGFIENLRGYLPPHGQIEALSEKQINWLDDLFERRFA